MRRMGTELIWSGIGGFEEHRQVAGETNWFVIAIPTTNRSRPVPVLFQIFLGIEQQLDHALK